MKDTKAMSTNTTYFYTIVLYHDSDHFQEKTEFNEEKDMQNT